MSKHVQKNTRQQDPKNRLNTVTSVGPEGSSQSNGQEMNNMNDSHEVFISEQEIQQRAYEIYQQTGGSDIDNWLEAEKRLQEEHRSAAK